MSEDYTFEKEYWGDCCNTFDEDQKHYVYARLMGIQRSHYSFITLGKTILDIGGGPSSMLLKTKGLKRGLVVDPIEYPLWTRDRYGMMNIDVLVDAGEHIHDGYGLSFDEVWIYNCMQHAVDPEKIIKNALAAAPTLRIFEWIDIPAHDGHPHELTEANLNKWIGAKGSTVILQEQGCYGHAYYGTFERLSL